MKGYKNLLKFKNSKSINIGLDIGGSLTKVAIYFNKTNYELYNVLKNEYDFVDEVEFEDNFLYIKNFQTSKFASETIDFLKSIIIIN